mgnify:CR=1 FL=1
MSKAQASVTAVEAAIGVILLTSVAFTFALGLPGEEDARTEAQLETYAEDTATLLLSEAPRHEDQTRLSEVTKSRSAFDRERDALERRIERILPANVMFRLETRFGPVGYRLPGDVQTGDTTILTPNGEVTLRVWYV